MYKQIPVFLLSGFKGGWQVILLFVLFAIIIVAAYYASYFIARAQQGSKRNSNLQLIEAISIGQGKNLQLVRLGSKYVVISVCKNQVNTIATLDEKDIVIGSMNDSQKILPFSNILDKYRKSHKDLDVDRGEEHHESKDE